MRMEDLDRDRSRVEYAKAALDDLRWLGIHWQEGPDVGGPYVPYVQSLRQDVYFAAWKRLRQGNFIYPCSCSRKDLAAALSAPHESTRPEQDTLDDEPVYPGTCRPPQTRISRSDMHEKAGEEDPGVMNWRFRVPDEETIDFTDLNLGPQRFVAGVDFGDFLIWRREGGTGSSPRAGLGPQGGGVPSYQLACVADDAAMEITEVVRGADLLKSTARQILLNRALVFRDPAWFHCSLVTDQKGLRLAKRHDALSIRSLRQLGRTQTEVISAELR
jgi:glutamyl/glutaminyl-tRNA synthetase